METKICNKCGRELPIEQFRIMNNKESAPYHLGQCKDCEYIYQRKYLEKKNEITFSDNLEMLIDIEYKEIIPERILNLDDTGIIPIGTDEIFVKLINYPGYYLSNYGRTIHKSKDKYSLLNGNYDSYGALKYSVTKNIFNGKKWVNKRTVLYVAKAVVEQFVVNPDVRNNVYIWHSGFDKEDCYYRNLYPLNQEQYRIVKNHYNKTGNDSVWFIMNVINEIRFKPSDFSKKCMQRTMCGVGYHGREGVDCTSRSYLRWADMMARCYNEKFLERNLSYRGSRVCTEWQNYSNYEIWYNEHYYEIENEQMDCDKDILFKCNKLYSPETCCIVPHSINTLFVNGKSNRGELPVGVNFEKVKGKYRSAMSYCGHIIKLGTFSTSDEAFARYKEYKEDFIQDIAEQYKSKIPLKIYEAMMNWKIEIND